VIIEYAERCGTVVDDVEYLFLSDNDLVVHCQLDGLRGTERVAAHARSWRRNSAVNLLAPLMVSTIRAYVGKQAVV
jgi:hypothetical protein